MVISFKDRTTVETATKAALRRNDSSSLFYAILGRTPQSQGSFFFIHAEIPLMPGSELWASQKQIHHDEETLCSISSSPDLKPLSST